jgi:hypothetical protein
MVALFLIAKQVAVRCWWLTSIILAYSRGRDGENLGSKPAWANNSKDPISKNPITKKGWWSGLRCRP